MTQATVATPQPLFGKQTWNEWVRETRRARMNIIDAAKLLGFSEFTLCEIELGRRLFSQEELDRFLTVMNTTVPEHFSCKVADGADPVFPLETDPKVLERRHKTMLGLQRRHQAIGNAVGGSIEEAHIQDSHRAMEAAAKAAVADATAKIRRFLEIEKILRDVPALNAELAAISAELRELNERYAGCLPKEIASRLVS